MIVKVTTVAPGIVVWEFGSVVIVITGIDEELLPGVAVTVRTLALLGGIVIVLPPGCVIVEPDGPPTTVVVITLGFEEGPVDEALVGMVMVDTPFGRTVTTLGPIVVVMPNGPPETTVTMFGLLVPLAGMVTTLLPPGGTVTVLGPGKTVVRPLGPPSSVVTTLLPLIGRPEVIIEPEAVGLL